MKKIIIATLLIATVFLTACASDEQHKELAMCLSDNGVSMYGAATCPHCEQQKHMFGDAFKYVPYVECLDVPEKCLEAEVTLYPTWIRADGERLEGRQELSDLAEWAGC